MLCIQFILFNLIIEFIKCRCIVAREIKWIFALVDFMFLENALLARKRVIFKWTRMIFFARTLCFVTVFVQDLVHLPWHWQHPNWTVQWNLRHFVNWRSDLCLFDRFLWNCIKSADFKWKIIPKRQSTNCDTLLFFTFVQFFARCS